MKVSAFLWGFFFVVVIFSPEVASTIGLLNKAVTRNEKI